MLIPNYNEITRIKNKQQKNTEIEENTEMLFTKHNSSWCGGAHKNKRIFQIRRGNVRQCVCVCRMYISRKEKRNNNSKQRNFWHAVW